MFGPRDLGAETARREGLSRTIHRRAAARASNPQRRPVVVGVRDATKDETVIEWAATEARAGGTSLLIVHAYWWPIGTDPYGYVVWLGPPPLAEAQAVVNAAARHVEAFAPGLEVITRVRPGSAGGTLVSEGRKAELIVIGRSRPSRFPPWVLTVSDEVVRSARGRVVIVGE
jgi:hypothetical protein